MRFFSLPDAHGVFCDAAAQTPEGALLFASLWGRDTAIQGLLGTLQLDQESGGLRYIKLERTDSSQVLDREWSERGLWVPNANELDKLSGRMPRSSNVIGTLLQTFVFDKRLKSTSTSSSSFVITRDLGSEEQIDDLLWRTFKQGQPLPLLDCWKAQVLAYVRDSGAIKPLATVGQLQGWVIDTIDPDVFSRWVSSSIRSGSLAVH